MLAGIALAKVYVTQFGNLYTQLLAGIALAKMKNIQMVSLQSSNLRIYLLAGTALATMKRMQLCNLTNEEDVKQQFASICDASANSVLVNA